MLNALMPLILTVDSCTFRSQLFSINYSVCGTGLLSREELLSGDEDSGMDELSPSATGTGLSEELLPDEPLLSLPLSTVEALSDEANGFSSSRTSKTRRVRLVSSVRRERRGRGLSLLLLLFVSVAPSDLTTARRRRGLDGSE